jgi:hypothetical protein
MEFSFVKDIKVVVEKMTKNHRTPGPRLMRVHLVQNSTSAKFEKSPNIHLVRIFALSD